MVFGEGGRRRIRNTGRVDTMSNTNSSLPDRTWHRAYIMLSSGGILEAGTVAEIAE